MIVIELMAFIVGSLIGLGSLDTNKEPVITHPKKPKEKEVVIARPKQRPLKEPSKSSTLKELKAYYTGTQKNNELDALSNLYLELSQYIREDVLESNTLEAIALFIADKIKTEKISLDAHLRKMHKLIYKDARRKYTVLTFTKSDKACKLISDIAFFTDFRDTNLIEARDRIKACETRYLEQTLQCIHEFEFIKIIIAQMEQLEALKALWKIIPNTRVSNPTIPILGEIRQGPKYEDYLKTG